MELTKTVSPFLDQLEAKSDFFDIRLTEESNSLLNSFRVIKRKKKRQEFITSQPETLKSN